MKNEHWEGAIKEMREYEKNGNMMSYRFYCRVNDSMNNIKIIII